MKLKEAMKLAKKTGKPQRVTEGEPIEQAKVQVSVRIDLSVLEEIKRQSDTLGIPYTTLMNSMLKQHLMADHGLALRLARIEKALKIS